MNCKDLLNNLHIDKKLNALNALESQYKVLSLYTQDQEEINLYLELVTRICHRIPNLFKNKDFEFDLLVEYGGSFQQEDKQYRLLKFKNTFNLKTMTLNGYQYEDKDELVLTLTDLLSQEMNCNIDFGCSAFKHINLDNTLSYITFKQDFSHVMHASLHKKTKKSPKAMASLTDSLKETIYEKLTPVSYKKYDTLFKVDKLESKIPMYFTEQKNNE